MRLKYFFIIIALISIGHIARAENHSSSPKLAEEFEIAVKNVETKNFIEAVKIFDKLAKSGLPEAQFNLSLLYSSGLGAPKKTPIRYPHQIVSSLKGRENWGG